MDHWRFTRSPGHTSGCDKLRVKRCCCSTKHKKESQARTEGMAASQSTRLVSARFLPQTSGWFHSIWTRAVEREVVTQAWIPKKPLALPLGLEHWASGWPPTSDYTVSMLEAQRDQGKEATQAMPWSHRENQSCPPGELFADHVSKAFNSDISRYPSYSTSRVI